MPQVKADRHMHDDAASQRQLALEMYVHRKCLYLIIIHRRPGQPLTRVGAIFKPPAESGFLVQQS